eukprot:COSAG02_NODE_19307_length_889_cov_1.160759_1_plen_62_part_01
MSYCVHENGTVSNVHRVIRTAKNLQPRALVLETQSCKHHSDVRTKPFSVDVLSPTLWEAIKR